MDQAQGSQQTALGVVGMVAVAVAYTSFFLQLQLYNYKREGDMTRKRR